MRTKTLLAALALAMVASIGFTGESADQGGRARGDRGRQQSEISGERGRRNDRVRQHRQRPARRNMHHGMRMQGPGMGMMFLADRLEMTAEQKAAFVTVLTENFRANLELRFQMSDTVAKIRGLRRSGSASSEDLIAANRQLGEIRGRMEALHSGLRGKLAAIWTPEQQAKIDAIQSTMLQRRHAWGNGMRPGFGADRDGWRSSRPGSDRDGWRSARGEGRRGTGRDGWQPARRRGPWSGATVDSDDIDDILDEEEELDAELDIADLIDDILDDELFD